MWLLKIYSIMCFILDILFLVLTVMFAGIIIWWCSMFMNMKCSILTNIRYQNYNRFSGKLFVLDLCHTCHLLIWWCLNTLLEQL